MTEEQVKIAINAQAAELAMIRLLLHAALRQLPDPDLLLSNVSEMAEDHEVRAMFSDRPESFFQSFRQYRNGWEELLADLIATTGGSQRGDS